MKLNKTELQDLDYLLGKIIDGTPFYALEISKAKYLLGRVKELLQSSPKEKRCPDVFIERAAQCTREGIRAICGTDEEYSEYVKNMTQNSKKESGQ